MDDKGAAQLPHEALDVLAARICSAASLSAVAEARLLRWIGEFVRIARALRTMPTVAGLFEAGRLSYSKVRAATRLVGELDEAHLA